MRIIDHNNEKLVIQYYPIHSWAFFSAFILLGLIGLFLPANSADELLVGHITAGAILGFCIIFIFVFDSVKINTWSFNKRDGILTVNKMGLLGPSSHDYLLKEIYKVDIEQESDQIFYGIKLILLNRKTLHLCGDNSLSIEKAQQGVRLIQSFLHIKHQ